MTRVTASNLVKEAEAKHLPIIEGYWPKDAGRVNGTFEAIVCMNVLAHVDKPKDFLEACEKALAPGGVIIIQPSQARMFENCEFDTCYHEHISFFNSRSINALANSVGLELKATSLVKIHGDSPVYFLAKKNDRAFKDPSPFFRIGDFAIDEDLFAYENRVGIFNSKTYDDFSNRSQLVLRRFKKQVEDHRALGYQIVFVGAAAKAMTVINASGVKPDFFLDEALLKIGKIAPGVGVVIEPA